MSLSALFAPGLIPGTGEADPLDVNWSTDFGAPGFEGEVRAAITWNSTLVAAGSITHAGGSPVQNVVSWNGVEFVQMGAGLNAPVTSLAVVGAILYAAGDFTASGGTPLPHVARWHLGGSASVDQTIQPAVDSGLRMSFLSRNPARDQVSLILRLPAPANISADVCDASGRRVRTLESGRFVTESYRIRWDGRDDAGRHVGAGVFWVRVTTEKEQVSRKVVWAQ